MSDVQSFLDTFLVAGIALSIVSFVIGVFIKSMILRYFVRKQDLPDDNKRAFIAVLIPSLVFLALSLLVFFIKLPDIILIIGWVISFIVLAFSVMVVYQTSLKISSIISLKIFLIVFVIVILGAGIQTIVGSFDKTLDKIVPQAVCTTDCAFAYSLTNLENGPLTVKGYNVPSGKYEGRADYLLFSKTFNVEELNTMKTGKLDMNGNEVINGQLDANNCNYFDFSREGSGEGGGICKKTSKNFFTNLKNILV